MEEEREVVGAAATEPVATEPVAIAETAEAAETETAMEEETEAKEATDETDATEATDATDATEMMAEPVAEAGQGMLTPGDPEEDTYGVEAEAVRQVYPTFDLTREMQDPAFRALVRGEARPTLRQVYELCHREALMAEAVSTAVAEAVSRAEAQLVSHIQARGQRPAENGMDDRGAVRMHPDVGRLTRSDRARLARRAQEGESIRL